MRSKTGCMKRAPPHADSAHCASNRCEERATFRGVEYPHICVLGTIGPYRWRVTKPAAWFTCAWCGEPGVCVACSEEQGQLVPAHVTPVLCRRHGGLEPGEGVALAVGEPWGRFVQKPAPPAYEQEQFTQPALIG